MLLISCSGGREYYDLLSKKYLNQHLLLGIKVKSPDNDYIIIVDNTNLYNNVYLQYYENSIIRYSDFIRKVIENKIDISHHIVNKENNIIPINESLFQISDLDSVINKYFIKKSNDLYFKKEIADELKYNLVMYMTNHKYFIIFDDYEGMYKLTYYKDVKN
jgi:hypothetical protein